MRCDDLTSLLLKLSTTHTLEEPSILQWRSRLGIVKHLLQSYLIQPDWRSLLLLLLWAFKLVVRCLMLVSKAKLGSSARTWVLGFSSPLSHLSSLVPQYLKLTSFCFLKEKSETTVHGTTPLHQVHDFKLATYAASQPSSAESKTFLTMIRNNCSSMGRLPPPGHAVPRRADLERHPKVMLDILLP